MRKFSSLLCISITTLVSMSSVLLLHYLCRFTCRNIVQPHGISTDMWWQ
jgi:hypothetical protein